ncbi:hypothetical protein D3C80_2152410 [compost metagenome]
MATEAQYQVQLRSADFQQEMGVARQAGDQAGVAGAYVQHDGRRRGEFIRRFCRFDVGE